MIPPMMMTLAFEPSSLQEQQTPTAVPLTMTIGASMGLWHHTDPQVSALGKHVLVVLMETFPSLYSALYPHLTENADCFNQWTEGTACTVEVMLVTNREIHEANRVYRQKDQPTDVLTFAALEAAAASEIPMPLLDPSEAVDLGQLLLSLEWALQAPDDALHPTPRVSEQGDEAIIQYLQERLIHGLLHLHGIHHDTMEDYRRVVAIQQAVLAVL